MMKAKRRLKKTCFGCRALHISPVRDDISNGMNPAGAGCLLGWDIEVANQPGGVSFYGPAAGVKCPKPMTHAALTDAVQMQVAEKENNKQLSLLSNL
jgi:hypothetical protein